jgi:protein-S-isoprenylcysteine O-methyltransferase Ste14
MASLRRRLRPRLLIAYGLAVALVWAARPSQATLALGALPIVLGEGVRLWATGYLHKNDALTVAGPYAFIRHPLYLGTLLIASGFALMAWSPLAAGLYAVFLLVFFLYYLPYKNRIEGARLESLYGDTYRRYSAAVPPLLPRLTPYRPLAAEPAAVPSWQPERFSDNHEVGTALVVALGVVGMVTRALI